MSKVKQNDSSLITRRQALISLATISAGAFIAASYDEASHFMLIEVDDKQVSFQAVSETGTVVDSGLIKQG
ncbi:MAG: hypothetical protein WBV94_03005 [Blastocatellia bacterium]